MGRHQYPESKIASEGEVSIGKVDKTKGCQVYASCPFPEEQVSKENYFSRQYYTEHGKKLSRSDKNR